MYRYEYLFVSLFLILHYFRWSCGDVGAFDAPFFRVEVVGAIAKVFHPANGFSVVFY
jgi:hypothetical protein